jgi:hypothetical protein
VTSNRIDGDYGDGRFEHHLVRTDDPEASACGQRTRCDVHDVLVGDVRVGEQDPVDVAFYDQRLESALRFDGDTLRISVAREFARVAAVGLAQFAQVLSGRLRERDHLDVVPPAEHGVEVVVIPASSPGYQDSHPDSDLGRECKYR